MPPFQCSLLMLEAGLANFSKLLLNGILSNRMGFFVWLFYDQNFFFQIKLVSSNENRC